MGELLLDIKDLSIQYVIDGTVTNAVNGISMQIHKGECMGLVGETGAGKTTTALSILRLLPKYITKIQGDIEFDGESIMNASEKRMRELRGRHISMIFQDPMTFLNPILKVGTQIEEQILRHTKCSKKEARERAIELMKKVGIPSPEKRIDQYPFQFSGGMRQRIVIAIALANHPKLIIADEPTTALDVTIQAQVLELIDELKKSSNSAIIMISHDLGVVAKLCDRIAIMYGGKIVEIGTDKDIFYNPKHPYTQGLLNCIANPDDDDAPLQPIAGSPPDLLNPPKGCPFVDRCPKAMKICKNELPEVTHFSDTHECACWLMKKEAVAK